MMRVIDRHLESRCVTVVTVVRLLVATSKGSGVPWQCLPNAATHLGPRGPRGGPLNARPPWT